MLARFTVLSRLKRHENSTIFAKMRVYDGESLKETDPRARSLQEYKDSAGVEEGMDGASTRFAFKVLAATFNHDTTEVAADPVHLMYVLEQSIRRDQLPQDTEKRYLEFIKANSRRAMRSSSAMKSRRRIWNRITTMGRICSTATCPMPTRGSRTSTSRTRTPGSCSTASCSIRN
jgi:predicted Ser/Thr protein kinase